MMSKKFSRAYMLKTDSVSLGRLIDKFSEDGSYAIEEIGKAKNARAQMETIDAQIKQVQSDLDAAEGNR